MNNLFVASSPLQLLANYIIANSIHEADSNSLVLLGECKWNDFLSLKKMASDDSTWNNIINYDNWLGRKSKFSTLKAEISAMQKELRQIAPIDRVFLATDKYPQFQLLVEMTGNSSYIRTKTGYGPTIAPTVI